MAYDLNVFSAELSWQLLFTCVQGVNVSAVSSSIIGVCKVVVLDKYDRRHRTFIGTLRSLIYILCDTKLIEIYAALTVIHISSHL